MFKCKRKGGRRILKGEELISRMSGPAELLIGPVEPFPRLNNRIYCLSPRSVSLQHAKLFIALKKPKIAAIDGKFLLI